MGVGSSVPLSVDGGRSIGAMEMHRIFKQLSWLGCPVGGQHGWVAGTGAGVMAAQATDAKTNTNAKNSVGMILAICSRA